MTSCGCLRIRSLSASFGVRSAIGNWQGLFRIRIEFQISSRKSSPELGSDYGTKPSRSFHEETFHPHCPGNRAHPERIPQRVCQRVHQHASPRLVHNADHKLDLLRWRSRRASGRRRSRICSGIGQHPSECLIGGVDQGRILLRRGSGRASRRGRSGLCAHQHASQRFIGSVDPAGILLRRGSGRASRWRRSGLCSGTDNCDHPALSLVGRLPLRGDGQ
jgi:hypothetical protein